MGKSAWDVAALLSNLVKPKHDYTQYTMHPFTDIRRYRLGVPRVGFEPQGSALERKEKRKIFDEALEKLGGAVIVDPLNNPQLDEMLRQRQLSKGGDDGEKWHGTWNERLLVNETYEAMNGYLKGLENTEIRCLEDLVRWNNEHPVRLSLKLLYFNFSESCVQVADNLSRSRLSPNQ